VVAEVVAELPQPEAPPERVVPVRLDSLPFKKSRRSSP
jgi:hypothetical protein